MQFHKGKNNIMLKNINYSKTINLPKTNFKMKANLANRSEAFIKIWTDMDLYNKIREKNKNCKSFILHDGPPYANAHIHIGTGLNKILKDFIIKYKSMCNFYIQFIPGWDCHGLPIEQMVLKKLKTNKNNIDKTVFRQHATAFVDNFVEIQKNEFKKLGVIADWKNPYLTSNANYEAKVIKMFGNLTSKGYIYRGKKPVYWCINCETALADAEIEYMNQLSDSIFVKFQILSCPNKLIEKTNLIKFNDFSVLIWTTTPWSLPANVALAFNEKTKYVFVVYTLVNNEYEKLIVAKNLVTNIKNKIKAIRFKILFELNGYDFINMKCKNPLINVNQTKCVTADFVSIEDGTGIVHIAPSLGQEDYNVGLKYKFDINSPIDHKGVYTDEIPKYKGIHIFKACELIIKELEKNNKLLLKSKLNHSYPHCWRCKKPIIFRTTPQWFLAINHNNLRNKLLKSIENVTWIPEYGKNRIKSMLKYRPDWCLSRQRLWGVPIPIFYCEKCNNPILDLNIIDKVALLFAKKGSGAWFEIKEEEFLYGMKIKCKTCGSLNFKKGNDILDVWFESGCSHDILINKQDLPADLYIEGTDQHRGWFQTSLILSLATKMITPYKNVMTHGFVVDGHGKKMSKSIGNFISSDQLANKYGPDIIRFWIASSNYKEDIKISDEIIQGVNDGYRKIRNTMRFLLSNLYDFNKSQQENLSFNKIDMYILHHTQLLIREVTTAYELYEFHKVISKINNFCTTLLSGFYFDITKDILYCDKKNSCRRISIQSTMFNICCILIKLIAPILSFTAEEAWSEIRKLMHCSNIAESVFLSEFPKIKNDYILNKKILEKLDTIINIRKQIFNICEKLRQEKKIGSILETSITINVNKKYSWIFEDIELLYMIIGSWDIKKNILKKDEKLFITVNKSKYKKCERCWKYIKDIKNNLCIRCNNAIIKK
jgi:isoleucyl-tRNA synthetase